MDFEENPDEAVQKLKKEELQLKQVDTYLIRPNFQRKLVKICAFFSLLKLCVFLQYNFSTKIAP